MDFKRKLFGVLTLVGLPVLVVGMFLNVWELTDGTNSSFYKLFEEFKGLDSLFKLSNQTFQNVWAILFVIFTVIALVALCAFAVMLLLEWLGYNKIKPAFISKILSYVLLATLVLNLIMLTVFTMVNVIEFDSNTYLSINASIGSFVILAGILISTVFAMLYSCRKKKA